MKKAKTGTLIQIKPNQIEYNKDNPRVLFDEKDLSLLKQSIHEVGVLVPLIVYGETPSSKKYVLLDGQRRLICAKRLNLPTVPANKIDAPSRLQNILLMFNIHNVRKDWELVPTALKLQVVMRMLPKKAKTPSSIIAKITGMSTIRIAECKRILSFDKKYIDMALDTNPHTRIRGDFFSQLAAGLEQLDNFPEIKKEYSKNKIIDLMIEKYRDGTIVNIIREFRMLRKILASEKKGVEKKIITLRVKEFLKSKPLKDKSGKVSKKAITIEEVFNRTSYSVFKEEEIIKKSTELEEILSKFNIDKARNLPQLIKSLERLVNRIDKILSKG